MAAIVDHRDERFGAEAPAGVAVHRGSAIVAVCGGTRAVRGVHHRALRPTAALAPTIEDRLHRQRRWLHANGEPVLDGRWLAALGGRSGVDVRAGHRCCPASRRSALALAPSSSPLRSNTPSRWVRVPARPHRWAASAWCQRTTGLPRQALATLGRKPGKVFRRPAKRCLRPAMWNWPRARTTGRWNT